MASFPVKIRLGAVDRLSGTLKKVTGGLGRMKAATQRASNSFKLFQERTKKLRAGLKRAGGAMKSAGSGMLRTVTAPILGIGAAIIATAAKFEKSMNKVKALTGATGESFTKMRDLAKKLGATTQFSASQAADAMSFLGMAGFSTNDILAATPALLNLAAAAGSDLAETANITSNMMGAFNLEASETGRVSDILARATSGANVTLESLGETFKSGAPIAKQFGASFEDFAAAAGLLGNVGIQGSAAGTSLKNMFLGLASPAGKASKLLEAMGIKTFDKTSGKMLGFAEIMKNLGNKLKQLPADARLGVLKEVFGKIGIAGGAALQDMAAKGTLDTFITKMTDTSITAEGMAKTMNEGAAGGVKSLMSALEGLAISIGDSGILQTFTDIVKEITLFVREISDANPELFKMGAVFAIVAAAIGPVLILFGSMITIIPGLIALWGLLGTVTLAALWPFLLIAGAVLAFIALAALLIANWDEVVIFFKWAFGGLADLFVDFITFPQLIIDNWHIIGPALKKIWKDLSGGALDMVGEGWENLKMLPELIELAWGNLPLFFNETWKLIKKEFVDGWQGIKDVASDFRLFGDFLKQEAGIGAPGDIVPEVPKGMAEKLKGIKFDRNKNIDGANIKTPSPFDPAASAAAAAKAAGRVTVDFKNVPKGTNITTDSTDKEIFDINTGLQGAG